MFYHDRVISTYGHSQLETGHPVRSAIHKQLNGRLVLRWVTTWESLLLYVLHSLFAPWTLDISFDRQHHLYCATKTSANSFAKNESHYLRPPASFSSWTYIMF
ncbi:hypothetical protein KCU95_g12264, partial [Aureobasidium melanogenum]